MQTSRHHSLLDAYIQCLHEERFYDAHEALEEIWFPRRFEDDSEMKLLKGFINAAVSFELIKRGRKQASTRAWNNYLKYKPLLETLDSLFTPLYHKMTSEIEKIHLLYR